MILFTTSPQTDEAAVTIADLAGENPGVFRAWLSERWDLLVDYALRMVVALILFFIVTRILKHLLKLMEKAMDRRGVEPTAKQFVLTLTKASVLALTIVTIIVQLNIVAASSIAALIASAGVAISLAMQGALSNFAGGVLLMLNKPFRAGDYIIVKGADVEGTVEKIEIYYTTIRSLAGERILIPNSALTGQAVVNQAQNGTKVLILRVGISYEEEIGKAKEVLERLLSEEPRIQESLRRVVVDELGESQVTMMCIARVAATDYNNVRFALNERIRETFREEGIQIPYNQLDVHLVTHS